MAATEVGRRKSDGRIVSITIVVRADTDWSRYDLDSIVRHEVGHALGLPHSHDGLMAEFLPPGSAPPVSASDISALCRLTSR
jgi:predicted Zn-dependent protease